MADDKRSEEGTDAKTARAARRAEAKAEKLREAEELRTRRRGQLEQAQAAVQELEQRLQTERNSARTYADLTSHLDGFYEEIDKLAKGKTMLEATDLVVETANNIVRDAKSIIVADAYMERVKEFVPAGNNPVYPDVLVTLRTVRQALSRFGEGRTGHEKRLLHKLSEVRTVVAALECSVEGTDWPSKEDLEDKLDTGTASADWLFQGNDGEEYFDFDRLDRRKLDKYFSEGINRR
jgi:DNA repair exonuclease SbcCD ATPase subunit